MEPQIGGREGGNSGRAEDGGGRKEGRGGRWEEDEADLLVSYE